MSVARDAKGNELRAVVLQVVEKDPLGRKSKRKLKEANERLENGR